MNDRRIARIERRTDRKEERQDNRQERREDRREAKQTRIETRVNARDEKRDDRAAAKDARREDREDRIFLRQTAKNTRQATRQANDNLSTGAGAFVPPSYPGREETYNTPTSSPEVVYIPSPGNADVDYNPQVVDDVGYIPPNADYAEQYYDYQAARADDGNFKFGSAAIVAAAIVAGLLLIKKK